MSTSKDDTPTETQCELDINIPEGSPRRGKESLVSVDSHASQAAETTDELFPVVKN